MGFILPPVGYGHGGLLLHPLSPDLSQLRRRSSSAYLSNSIHSTSFPTDNIFRNRQALYPLLLPPFVSRTRRGVSGGWASFRLPAGAEKSSTYLDIASRADFAYLTLPSVRVVASFCFAVDEELSVPIWTVI